MAPKMGRKGGKAAAAAPAKVVGRQAKSRIALGEAERALVGRLADKTGLLPREILERALAAYAAAVAPGLPLAPPARAAREGPADKPAQRLFLSIDGKDEVEVGPKGIVLGRDAECDVVLDVPLISPRHARFIPREGRWIFEDLRSARGSYRHGERVDVRFVETGDELDLGGFLPVRARLL